MTILSIVLLWLQSSAVCHGRVRTNNLPSLQLDREDFRQPLANLHTRESVAKVNQKEYVVLGGA